MAPEEARHAVTRRSQKRNNIDRGNAEKLAYLREEALKAPIGSIVRIHLRKGITGRRMSAWTEFCRSLVKHDVIDGAKLEGPRDFSFPKASYVPATWSNPETSARTKAHKSRVAKSHDAAVSEPARERFMTMKEYQQYKVAVAKEAAELGITIR